MEITAVWSRYVIVALDDSLKSLEDQFLLMTSCAHSLLYGTEIISQAETVSS